MGKAKEQVGRKCPHCGAMITFDEYFCRACHKRIDDQQNLDAPSNRTPGTCVVEMRRSWVTMLVSVIFPGLGQFYNGDTAKGLLFNAAFMILSFGSIGGPRRILLILGVWILALVEALLSSWRINSYRRPGCGTSYLLWIELAVLGAIVAMHLYTGLPDNDYLGKLLPAAYLFPA
jgi:hypothetical protein